MEGGGWRVTRFEGLANSNGQVGITAESRLKDDIVRTAIRLSLSAINQSSTSAGKRRKAEAGLHPSWRC